MIVIDQCMPVVLLTFSPGYQSMQCNPLRKFEIQYSLEFYDFWNLTPIFTDFEHILPHFCTKIGQFIDNNDSLGSHCALLYITSGSGDQCM